MSTVPILLRWSFLDIITITVPSNAKTGAKFSGLSIRIPILSLSIPDMDRIQEVKVVPILAP